jgi:hypothetical protein
MKDYDVSAGDIEMVTYWLQKYTACKNKNERKEVQKAAMSFLVGDGILMFLDECIQWHSRNMDEFIWKRPI